MVNSAGGMCSSLKSCLKFCIIFINIIVLLAGCAALGTGIWIVIDEESFFNTVYPDIVDVTAIDKEFLRHAAIVLASGGAATLCFALLGIAAAATVNSCLLGLYILVITLVIAVEVAAIILGIVFKRAWENELDEELLNSIRTQYGQSNGFTVAMDKLQKDRMCCGWNNGSDYASNTQLDSGMVVPESCCKMENSTQPMTNCTTAPTTNNTYMNEGCKNALEELFVNYQGCIIGLGASIAGLELFLLLMAIILIANHESNKYNMS